MREVALEEGLVGEVRGFAGYGSVLEGQLCQVSREMAGPPRTSPCPLCAEYYLCQLPCPYTAVLGLPEPDPTPGALVPHPQSLGVGKHPLSESQILEPRKKTESLKRRSNHFDKEFELDVPRDP